VTEKLVGTAVHIRNPRKSVSGKVVVFPEPIDLEKHIDPRTGKIIKNDHALAGVSVKNKILVAERFAFNAELEFLIFLFASSEVAPKGIVVDRVSSNLIIGAVMADIPIIFGFPESILAHVNNGDTIKIKIEEKVVEIKKAQ